jgi:DNA-binding transcriptional LysR family regulator
MKFRLRQMEVFRSVMLTGTISSAAKMLFISQPAVSRLISQTEESLGYKLFNRVKGKLVPTPEGEALYNEVEDFYQHAQRVDDFASDLLHGPAGVLNISSSPCLSYSVMPDAITRFTRRYPGIQVNYHTTMLNSMAQEILSNKVDLAVSVLPLEHINLEIQSFRTGRMVCVMPDLHPLAPKQKISLEDLAQYDLISHHPSIQFGKLVRTAFEAAGLDFNSRIHIHQTEVACSLVRAGMGVAIVDEFTVANGAWVGLQVRPLEQDILLKPSIARSVFDRQGTHAEKFVEILLSSNP